MVWLPRLEAFKPQMIFVSAGFDAHREDNMANMGLVEDDYAWITEQVPPGGEAPCAGPHRELSRGRLQPVGARAQRSRASARARGNLARLRRRVPARVIGAHECPVDQFADHAVTVEVVQRLVRAPSWSTSVLSVEPTFASNSRLLAESQIVSAVP